ncbi:hypothetical protein [Streptomyces sp. NPDC057199]|uniref:hypothetical protein n=1 Tax=Streptomyces sp. NPDC057199 TaxID=3346047 RepID=UPI00363FD120
MNAGETADPDATADPGRTARSAVRHTGLSAWGTFLAGIAALLTLFTACATAYVAIATYKDGRQQDDEKQEQQDLDFAQRVLVGEVKSRKSPEPGKLKVQIENRNLFPVGDLNLRVWGTVYGGRKPPFSSCVPLIGPNDRSFPYGEDSIACQEDTKFSDLAVAHEFDDIVIGPIVVPACTLLTIDLAAALDENDERSHDDLDFDAADFTDRRGSNWYSNGKGLFEKGSAKRLLEQPPWKAEVLRARLSSVRIYGLMGISEVSEKASNCK